MAFQYTTLVCEKPQGPGGQPGQGANGTAANGEGPGPAAGGAAGAAGEGGKAEGEGDGRRYWLQRRLRVATYRVGWGFEGEVARSARMMANTVSRLSHTDLYSLL